MNRPHCVNSKRPPAAVISLTDRLRLLHHARNAVAFPCRVTVTGFAISGRADTLHPAAEQARVLLASDMFTRRRHLVCYPLVKPEKGNTVRPARRTEPRRDGTAAAVVEVAAVGGVNDLVPDAPLVDGERVRCRRVAESKRAQFVMTAHRNVAGVKFADVVHVQRDGRGVPRRDDVIPCPNRQRSKKRIGVKVTARFVRRFGVDESGRVIIPDSQRSIRRTIRYLDQRDRFLAGTAYCVDPKPAGNSQRVSRKVSRQRACDVHSA